jgi:undecaprenyl-diphosphatase
MEIFHSAILGIVQGLTEFWPISSTAHLAIFPWFLHWHDPGLAFDSALHIGTLFAIIIFFWTDWISIFRPENRRILWFIIIGTIPAIIAGYFLSNYAETVLRAPAIIAVMLVSFGIVLYLADQYGKRFDEIQHLSWAKAIGIGLAQAIAIIPGVSRSGVTISAGLFSGLERRQAAKYSFMLSAPAILGAGIFSAKDLFLRGLIDSGWVAISVGFITSLIAGFLAIRFLLRFLETRGFGIFIWYRFVLAIAIILLAIYR